jgi:hypothetical protein
MVYRWTDITVIGGAALVLYDAALNDYKKRYAAHDMRSFFEKGTADIDMTWNMAIHPSMVQSHSKFMVDLGNKMTNQLKEFFKTDKKTSDKHIVKVIQRMMLETSIYENKHALFSDFTVSVVPKNTVERYGTYSIEIHFNIRGHILKIADLTLHDGFNSQQYTDNHDFITPRTSPLLEDPTYCTSGIQYYPNLFVPPNTFLIDLQQLITPVRIPLVYHYINQQLFAAGNLLLNTPQKEKGYINLRRVVYLMYLFSIASNTERNMANINTLLFEPLSVEQERFIVLLFKKIILITAKAPHKEETTRRIQEIVKPIAPLLKFYHDRTITHTIQGVSKQKMFKQAKTKKNTTTSRKGGKSRKHAV